MVQVPSRKFHSVDPYLDLALAVGYRTYVVGTVPRVPIGTTY